MSNWRKFNKRLFTKGPLHDFRAAVGLVRVGMPLALLGLKGIVEALLEPREWRGCWRGLTTGVRT